jgi:transcriptional regulator with XRE-family HTH domain
MAQATYQFAMQEKGHLSQSEIATRLGVSQTAVSKWHRGLTRPRRMGRQDYKHAVPPTVDVTPELIRLLGYYLAEGCIEPKRYRITFSFNRRETEKVHDVIQLMEGIFHINSPSFSHPEPTETCVSFKNRYVANCLAGVVGTSARTKRLPPFFFDLPRDEFLQFLQIFIACDGYVDRRGKLHVLTVNQELMTAVHWLCRLHGIKSNLRVRHIPTRTIRGRQLVPTTAYEIEIAKANNPFEPRQPRAWRAEVLEVSREPHQGYVYDLCGCQHEAFFGGHTPVLLHNTNRPDVLDPALLRPGRFDRQVVISLPDIVGREAILKVHTRKIRLAKDVDLKSVARQTPGFSGADLANLANEAALLAARLNKDVVGIGELEKAIERVIAGPERKTRVLNEREKKITAFHESGHALVALLTPETDPLHKVSIIPRGAHALGYTLQLPIEDRYTMSKKELIARMTVMMGGRAAEELVFGEITTGAQNDIETATEMARRMICEFGMSERLGNLTYGKRERQMFLGRDLFEERNYSEQTAVLIDEEIRRLIDTSYERARQTLTEHRAKLDLLANTLLEKEVLDGEEVKKLVGAFPENSRS